ncbi:distal tail protein Dit [Bacillus sp. FSL W8-0223]|uniref:distal tail protein Dit n=1 Tax=Bacillus sp. FSL W8-0223 TaxID=2954595 RepID=UPI004046D500
MTTSYLLDVIYKGIRLSNYCFITEIHRDVMPPLENVTMDIPDKIGTYFYRRKVNPRTFSVDTDCRQIRKNRICRQSFFV